MSTGSTQKYFSEIRPLTVLLFTAFFITLSLLSLSVPICGAVEVSLAWDPVSDGDLAGYRVYRATVPGSYVFGEFSPQLEATLPPGTEESHLTGLPEGTQYFVVTSFDLLGNESGPSNEVVLSQAGDELVADYGIYGLWNYDGGTWDMISEDDALATASWSGGLAASFTSPPGLWNYDGSAWSELSSWNPIATSGWSGGLAASFTGEGLWNYDGEGWIFLSNLEADSLTAWSGGLAVDFGIYGLWIYDGSGLAKIHDYDVAGIQGWSDGLAVDFGSLGLWNYDGASWSSLHPLGTEGMTRWSGGLALDFGAMGFWSYDGSSWTMLTSGNVETATSWAGGLAASASGMGLWNHSISWTRLSPYTPEVLAVADVR